MYALPPSPRRLLARLSQSDQYLVPFGSLLPRDDADILSAPTEAARGQEAELRTELVRNSTSTAGLELKYSTP